MARRESVVADLAVQLSNDGRMVPVAATLVFDPTDPFAVSLCFDLGAGGINEWTFGRELLSEGLRRPAGLGDVSLAPAVHGGKDVLELALSSPSGSAQFELPRGKVSAFLRRADAVVPSGTEGDIIDWDLELLLLTGTG